MGLRMFEIMVGGLVFMFVFVRFGFERGTLVVGWIRFA